MIKKMLVSAALGSCLALSGCGSAALTAGAVSANYAMQERGFGKAISDTVIQAEINEKWFNQDHLLFGRISAMVVEGKVLLTGLASDEQMMMDAVSLTWQVEGVYEVINEIVIDPDLELTDFALDSWIAAKFKAKMMFDGDVHSINYKFNVVNGNIYIIGIALSPRELSAVIRHAANTDYVREIRQYVRIKESSGPA